jgi:alkylated DNA nucleotide flippase Atl1
MKPIWCLHRVPKHVTPKGRVETPVSLTAYNAKLSNDGFVAKKKILTDSGLAMNREIADSPRWGAAEIRGRGRTLADRAVRIWPGPTQVTDTAPIEPQWWRLNQLLACIPAGRWTSYSDVAEVIGTHQVPSVLAWPRLPHPTHRVLKLSGEVSPEFRWVDPDRTDDPHAVLSTEGVLFDAKGRASAQQRLTAAELASLADLDVDTMETTLASQL